MFHAERNPTKSAIPSDRAGVRPAIQPMSMDNRPEALAQRQRNNSIRNSAHAMQQKSQADSINCSLRMVAQRNATPAHPVMQRQVRNAVSSTTNVATPRKQIEDQVTSHSTEINYTPVGLKASLAAANFMEKAGTVERVANAIATVRARRATKHLKAGTCLLRNCGTRMTLMLAS